MMYDDSDRILAQNARESTLWRLEKIEKMLRAVLKCQELQGHELVYRDGPASESIEELRGIVKEALEP